MKKIILSILGSILLLSLTLPMNLAAQRNQTTMISNRPFILNYNVEIYTSDIRYPDVCFGDENGMIVWNDYEGWAIYAALIDMDGHLIEPAAIQVSQLLDANEPCVAFDGTNYLVVWQEQCEDSWNISAARVSAMGDLLDWPAIIISDHPEDESGPEIAFDGTNYLIIWKSKDNDENGNIFGKRIGQDGNVIDNDRIAICEASGNQSSCSISYVNGIFLTVWRDERNGEKDIYGSRLNSKGEVLDPDGILISNADDDQWGPDVATDGNNFFVVWDDFRGGMMYADVYGARVSAGGEVMDINGIPILTAYVGQESPSVAYDGTNYVVVWNDYRFNFLGDVCCGRITIEGVPLDPDGIFLCNRDNYQYFVEIASNGSKVFAIWEDGVDYDNTINAFGTLINADGTAVVPNGKQYSWHSNEEHNSDVAFVNDKYLVAWHNWFEESANIYAVRVNTSGSVLDGNPIPVCNLDDYQKDPAVAPGTTDWILVWQDYRNVNYDIYATRIAPDGTVKDPGGILMDTDVFKQQDPDVGFDGTNWLVVYEEEMAPGEWQITGKLVDQNGTIISSQDINISNTTDIAGNPAVAFDGTNYLVVWADNKGTDGFYSIYGARVGTDGTVLDVPAIRISNSTGNFPRLTFGEDNYLVVWRDDSGDDFDVLAKRVSKDGVVLDENGIPVSTEAGRQMQGDVVFRGGEFITTWTDGGNFTDCYIDYGIWGAAISKAGLVTERFPLVVEPGHQTSSALARGQNNQCLMSFGSFVWKYNNVSLNSLRIHGGFLDESFGTEDENMMEYSEMIELYPNPFSDQIGFEINMKNAGFLSLSIYDMNGRLVEKLFDGDLQYGTHHIKWNSSEFNNGIYFYRVITSKDIIFGKLIKQ